MRIGLFGRNRGTGGQPRARMSWKMRLIPLVLFAIYGLYYPKSGSWNVCEVSHTLCGGWHEGFHTAKDVHPPGESMGQVDRVSVTSLDPVPDV